MAGSIWIELGIEKNGNETRNHLQLDEELCVNKKLSRLETISYFRLRWIHLLR
jgi:hypothetical protein